MSPAPLTLGPRVDGVAKIAVLRAGGLGDLVFTFPALDALTAAYPGAEIVLLGAPWHATLLAGRPGPVARCECVPAYPGVFPAGVGGTGDRTSATGGGGHGDDDEAETADAFFERMRAERFDLALQLHGGGRNSNPFVARLGARVTAGFCTPDAAPLDRWVRYVYYQTEVLRYLECVALVGAEPVTLAPSLAVTASDRRGAHAALGDGRGPYAYLHPGAGDARRRWPAEKFAAVGERLAACGLHVVVGGGTEDRDAAAAIAARLGTPERTTVVAGALDLPALVGVCAGAAVVVSNDSGPLHIAAATGTPTVGVYWCGNLVNAGPPFSHWHRAASSFRTTCPACGADNAAARCPHDDSFVADVGVDEVADHALDLVALSAAG